MDDEEIVARWYILGVLRNHHVADVAHVSNRKIAHYTGGMVDGGELDYPKILGFEGDVSIEYLRHIEDKLNGGI